MLPLEALRALPITTCSFCSSHHRVYEPTGPSREVLDEPAKGQVWTIKESLYLPVARFLDTNLQPKLSKDRLSNFRASVASFEASHHTKDTPRACIVTGLKAGNDPSVANHTVFLLGTLNGNNLGGYLEAMKVFTAFVGPEEPRNELYAHHIHITPPFSINNYVIALPIIPKQGIRDDEGHLHQRWGLPWQTLYDCEEEQVDRLNEIYLARFNHWNRLPPSTRDVYIKSFESRLKSKTRSSLSSQNRSGELNTASDAHQGGTNKGSSAASKKSNPIAILSSKLSGKIRGKKVYIASNNEVATDNESKEHTKKPDAEKASQYSPAGAPSTLGVTELPAGSTLKTLDVAKANTTQRLSYAQAAASATQTSPKSAPARGG